MIEQWDFGFKKGADSPGGTRSVPLGIWGLVEVSSRARGKRVFLSWF